MCLLIHFQHKNHGPIITKKHYLVYKVLQNASRLHIHKDIYISPYRNMPYEFGKVYEADIGKNRYYSVSEGLHAVRSLSAGKSLLKEGTLRKCFPAIIPAGSRIYYGRMNDVVSDKLIVFKDMKSLLKWAKNN